MEHTEPIFISLLAAIDRTLACGIGFRMLVSTTRWGIRLLQEKSEELLPLAEMISIRNTGHIGILWSLNQPSEPIELLFCCNRTTDTEDRTPPPSNDIEYAPRGNQGTSPHNSNEVSMGSNDEQSSNSDQPKSCASAAGRTTLSRTMRHGNTRRNTEQTHGINLADIGVSDPRSNVAANLGLKLTSRAISGPPSPAFWFYTISW